MPDRPPPDDVPDAPRRLLGGEPVGQILHGLRQRLVDQVMDVIVSSVPVYDELPAEVLQIDVRRVVYENLRTFEVGLTGGGLDRSALNDLAHSAYRRAEEGIPLQLVQSAYLVGARTAWSMVAEQAQPGDEGDLRQLGSDVLTHLAEVFSVVSAAYIEELRSHVGEDQSRRALLLRALLNGDRVQATAQTLELDLPEQFVAVRVALGEVTDEAGKGAGHQVARRRRMRALRAVLLMDYDEALAQVDTSGGLILLPDRAGPTATADRVDVLVARLAEAAGVPVHASSATAVPARVHEAARETADVLAIVQRSGRPPGCYRLSDVLLDYQFSRPGPGAVALLAKMDPLLHQGVLLDTLRVHIEQELVRSATAAKLQVHANTVDYRLGRIRALTGLDPSLPSHLAQLRAGLAVIDLTSTAGEGGS